MSLAPNTHVARSDLQSECYTTLPLAPYHNEARSDLQSECY